MQRSPLPRANAMRALLYGTHRLQVLVSYSYLLLYRGDSLRLLLAVLILVVRILVLLRGTSVARALARVPHGIRESRALALILDERLREKSKTNETWLRGSEAPRAFARALIFSMLAAREFFAASTLAFFAASCPGGSPPSSCAMLCSCFRFCALHASRRMSGSRSGRGGARDMGGNFLGGGFS